MAQQTKSTGSGQQTGASNLEFDIYSELHSLLKGNAALERYMQDARTEGDSEIESCFQAIHDQNKENVEKLRGLLAKKIAKAA
jgi:hypothetical protein